VTFSSNFGVVSAEYNYCAFVMNDCPPR